MAKAPISFGAYRRTGNPTLAAANCFVEEYPGASGPALQIRARAGLAEFETLDDGPIRGMAQKDGLLGNAALIVSGTDAYTLTAEGVKTKLTGTIAGDSLVDIDIGQDADLNSVARVATGSALYTIVGGVVTLEDFPSVGGAGASSVAYHRGFWLAVEAGTDKVYVQIPGDTTWDALSFSSAEFAPDPLVAVRSRGDQIVLPGTSSFEVFALSGNATDPIVPYGGLSFKIGCRSRYAAVICGDTLIFVDNTGGVRRFDGGAPKLISGPGLSEQIRAVSASDLRAWYFTADGHQFYVLTLGSSGTWVYDLAGGGDQWTTFESLGYDYWRAQLGCQVGDVTLAGDNLEAKVWRLDQTRRTDGDDTFTVKFCAMVEGAEVPIPCANVALLCDLGDVPREGQGSAPVISMRFSDNRGKTFGRPLERPLGVTGDFTAIPKWNGLGDIPPLLGRIFEFSVSDPVGRIFNAVYLNIP